MKIYQIFIAIVTILTLSKCNNSYAIFCGLFIYACLSIIPLVMFKESNRKMTKEEIIYLNKKRIEDEEYYNNFGELP